MQADTKQHSNQDNHLILWSLPLLEPDFDEIYNELQAEAFGSAWDE